MNEVDVPVNISNDAPRSRRSLKFVGGGVGGFVATILMTYVVSGATDALDPIDLTSWERFVPQVAVWIPLVTISLLSIALMILRPRLRLGAMGAVAGSVSLYALEASVFWRTGLF